jgi:hypothetical protein
VIKVAVSDTLSKPLAFTILRHAEDFPWRMQDIGLLGLWLDDRREYRLHVWDPTRSVVDPPIHDHPYDFTSTVIVGEITNTRFDEDPAGNIYIRHQRRDQGDGRHSSRVVLGPSRNQPRMPGGYTRSAGRSM